MAFSRQSRPWSKYERDVSREIRAKYPEASVRRNVRLIGQRSGLRRQIDVLVREHFNGRVVRTVVDTKHYGRRVDVTTVEAFIGLLSDVQADRGILIAPVGYTKGALRRAYRDDVDVDLDIVTFGEFKTWQADAALPYAGRNAVLLPAPLGWVIDATRRTGMLACLYRRGLTLEEAAETKEWMYVNLWDRVGAVKTVAALIREQNVGLLTQEAEISVRTLRWLRPRHALVRRAAVPSYPSLEITGFVQFTNAIFFAVLFTPPETERRNTRKLEYILGKVLPIRVSEV